MSSYSWPGVYVEEPESGARPIEGVGTAIAGFVGVAAGSTDPASPTPLDVPTAVTNWTQYLAKFGGFADGAYLPQSVYGFFQNGGGKAYVVAVATAAPQAAGELAAGPVAIGPGLQATLTEAATSDVTVEVVPREDDPAAFDLVVRPSVGEPTTIENLSTAKKGRQSATAVVNERQTLVRLEEAGGALERPPAGTHTLAKAATTGDAAAAPAVTTTDLIAGLTSLGRIDDVTMLAVPDLMSLPAEDVKAVQSEMVAQCEDLRDRMAILDPPQGYDPATVLRWRSETSPVVTSRYATLYWPWLRVRDPLRSSGTVLVPPSGHVAGIWGRNDDDRGVHKAPANETVQGALDVEMTITDREHGDLNPVGINVIRKFTGRGIRVWGARTMAEQSDPSRYVNVRRYMNYLRESIDEGTQWCVFEPNDPALWGRIERTIAAFLVLEWRKGALFGLTPAEAFYVKCDDELNTAESIDKGIVVCEIGVAPVKPAEFVVFRLSQFSGGRSLLE